MNRSARRLGGLGAVMTAGAAVVAAVLAQAGPAGAVPAAAGVSAAAQAPASASAYVPVRKTLYLGDHGPAVRKVQQRLAQLHYYPGATDGQFGQDTLEAVWAFKEVQGLSTGATANEIGYYMERALVHPRLPRALEPRGGAERIEINQSIQVLVLYKHNRPYLISHASTGGRYYYPCPPPYGGQTCGPAITPDGNYRAHWFASGWLTVPLGTMYNPVFFIGGAYAIHGDIPVPLYPASHGCVRIPMDIAAFFHQLIVVSETRGTPIYIRGTAP